MTDSIATARRMAFAAALLFLSGGLTGIPLALAETSALDADPGAFMAAHLNALMGAFWLLGAGWSLAHTRLGPRGLAWMYRLLLTAAYANWFVTALKAFWRVRGVSFTGDARNDTIAALLNALVVLPTLAGCALWAWGLRPQRA